MTRVEVGAMVVARSADGVFYRAEVLAVVGDGEWDVLFVDYGNKERVEVVTALPEVISICKCPALAVQCRPRAGDDKLWMEAVDKYNNYGVITVKPVEWVRSEHYYVVEK